MKLKLELREYQKNILQTCKEKNTLVILPTGTGKTIIAFSLIIERLKEFPDSKIFFLAPTKPLVSQHRENFMKVVEGIEASRVITITGDIRPERRESLYNLGKIIFVTPQTLQNDIIEGRVYFDDVSLMIFDEAHRAVKKYAYVFIAQKYMEQAKNPRILALTASPGYNLERIKEVMKNLFIDEIEIRVGYEKDIKPYIKKISIEKIEVELNEDLMKIKTLLDDAIKFKYEKLKEIGIIEEKPIGKKELKECYENLQKLLSLNPQDWKVRQSLSILAEIMKIDHALELLETQTLYTFIKYFEEMKEKAEMSKSISLKNFLDDVRIKKAYILAKDLLSKNVEHPKIYKLLEIVKENSDKKIIIFAQIRRTVDQIYNILLKEGYKCQKFLGKKEMKKSDQIRILKEFGENKFNILVATSVGEEGIDIPKVDIVIFYEPVPSEIRYIQRRGRTGRTEIGEVKILVTKKTRDEVFFWVAITKERKMLKLIRQLKKYIENSMVRKPITKTAVEKSAQKEDGLTKYFKSSTQQTIEQEKTNILPGKKTVPIIIADYREKESGLLQALSNLGVLIKLDNLEVGDYIIGEYIIERKTILDFLKSILDGRLVEQLEKLKGKKAIIILEGQDDIFPDFSINPNYIRSLILKIELDYKIPIIKTNDFIDTANYLYLLAKNAHEFVTPKLNQKQKDIEKIRMEILKQIPGIGEEYAKKLLDKYKSLKRIFEAPLVELERIIGEKRAKLLKKVYEEEFKNYFNTL